MVRHQLKPYLLFVIWSLRCGPSSGLAVPRHLLACLWAVAWVVGTWAVGRYGVRGLAGPGRSWWPPFLLATEWTGGQLGPGPELVRWRWGRLGVDLAATLLQWECPRQVGHGLLPPTRTGQELNENRQSPKIYQTYINLN